MTNLTFSSILMWFDYDSHWYSIKFWSIILSSSSVGLLDSTTFLVVFNQLSHSSNLSTYVLWWLSTVPSVGWPTSLTPTVESNLLTNYFFDFINYFYHAHLFYGCLRRISFLTDPSTSSTIWLTVLLVDNCFDSTRLYSLLVD